MCPLRQFHLDQLTVPLLVKFSRRDMREWGLIDDVSSLALLSLSPSWVPLTLFPLMIALRRGGVPKIRRLKLILGGDLII